MRILVIGGISRSLVNFRGPLLCAMRKRGHDVFACAGDPVPEAIRQLEAWGVRYFSAPIVRTGMSPWQDLKSFAALYRILRQIRPDVMLAYTIKPVVWGAVAARWAGVPAVYSMVEGLGYAFTPGREATRLMARAAACVMYRLALSRSRAVFFMNPDDIEEFAHRRLVARKKCVLINGTGIDLDDYAPAPLPEKPRFLMISRLLKDKGIGEYVAAAQIVRVNHPEAVFSLAGPLDPHPSGVSLDEVESWHREGVIEYLGVLSDVRPALAEASVYVLPSYYREGTPRTVLEAMSMGRPVITTNAPGCRETVRMPLGYLLDKNSLDLIQGENGFLVPVRNEAKLAKAMERFIQEPGVIAAMGRMSRKIAEEKYDVRKVNAVLLRTMGLA